MADFAWEEHAKENAVMQIPNPMSSTSRQRCGSINKSSLRVCGLADSRIVDPEVIALGYFAGYTQKWFWFDTSQKRLQRLFLGIDFRFGRAKGATHEALFVSYCRLLPPRPTAKLLEGNKVTGAGEGNRTYRQFTKSR